MAMRMNVKTSFGIDVIAYIRIDNMTGGKNGYSLTVNAYNLVGKEYKLIHTIRPSVGISPLEKSNKKTEYFFIPDLKSTKDFLAQGYEYLMTLNEFKTAKIV